MSIKRLREPRNLERPRKGPILFNKSTLSYVKFRKSDRSSKIALFKEIKRRLSNHRVIDIHEPKVNFFIKDYINDLYRVPTVEKALRDIYTILKNEIYDSDIDYDSDTEVELCQDIDRNLSVSKNINEIVEQKLSTDIEKMLSNCYIKSA
jgi:hypothetical protein